MFLTMKEFDSNTAIIISIFDGIFAGGIGGCIGGMVENIWCGILVGIYISMAMLFLDYKYAYYEI